MTSAEFQQKNRDYAHTNDRTIVIKEIAAGLRLFVDLSDHVIGLNIVRGRYEDEEIRFVRGVLRPGDIAIDAGAHIGFFTMHMAACVGPTGKVYAFEPLDANADLLERSIAENRFKDRIVFQRAAVGRRSERRCSRFQWRPQLGRRLPPSTAPRLLRATWHAADSARRPGRWRRWPPVRLIKMDVEGAEPQVVRVRCAC
jgi:FkbM family methyltransferase